MKGFSMDKDNKKKWWYLALGLTLLLVLVAGFLALKSCNTTTRDLDTTTAETTVDDATGTTTPSGSGPIESNPVETYVEAEDTP